MFRQERVGNSKSGTDVPRFTEFPRTGRERALGLRKKLFFDEEQKQSDVRYPEGI